VIRGRCDVEDPEESQVGDGHRVRCHLVGAASRDGSADLGEVIT
jgi:hypothetical protein